jgi:hypothetical protein
MKGGNILISVHTEDGAERTRVKEIFKKPTRLRQPKTLRIVRTPPPVLAWTSVSPAFSG